MLLLLKPAYLIAGCAHLHVRFCKLQHTPFPRSEALDDDDRYRMQDPKGRQESGDRR